MATFQPSIPPSVVRVEGRGYESPLNRRVSHADPSVVTKVIGDSRRLGMGKECELGMGGLYTGCR